MFKKICFLIVAASIIYINPVAFASSRQLLANYPTFSDALNQGDEVKAIIDFSKCKSLTQPLTEGLITGITFNNFIKLKFTNQQSYIATSVHALIKHNDYGYVYDFVDIQIYEDGSVKILQQFLNSRTSFPVGDEHQYTCNLSNGNDNNAVRLYDLQPSN